MSIKSFIFTLLALCTLPTFAVISEMEIWGDGTNWLYLLKDRHVNYLDGRVSIKQQADILWAAQQFKKEGVFVLVEDALWYDGANKKIQDCFKQLIPQTLIDQIQSMQNHFKMNASFEINHISTNCSPFAGLIRACATAIIPTYNTECSHAESFFSVSGQKITASEMTQDLATHVNELETNPAFKDFCTLCMRELKTLSSQNENGQEFIDRLSYIRSSLVEAKTIHKLSQLTNIQHVMICEGAQHIENIVSGLKALKYTKLTTFKNVEMPTITKPQTQKEFNEISQKALENPLDLKEIFTHIIKKPKVFPPASVAHAFKTDVEDALFLDSSHGQKYLAEAAMNDDNQSAAAPAAPSPMLIQSTASTAMSDK